MKPIALILLAGILGFVLFQFGPWQPAPDFDAAAAAAEGGAVPTDGPGPELQGGGTTTDADANPSDAAHREALATSDQRVRVSGMLVDAAGQAVADVPVHLRFGDGRSRGFAPFAMLAATGKSPDRATKSDAQGRFELEVPSGTGGHLSIDDPDLVWSKQPPRFLGSAEDLDLGSLAVARGAVLRGSVLTPDDTPVAKAKLQFVGYEGFGAHARQGESDAKGRFELRGLPGGTGYLTVSSEGHVGSYSHVELMLGQTREDLVIRVRRGEVLTGIVVDDQWKPVAGATVNVAGTGRRLATGGHENNNGSAVSDAKGEFRVVGLGAPPYNVNVNAKGHVANSVSNVKPEAGPVRVELARLGSVAGQVVDERGRPIAGSTVYSTTTKPQDRGGRPVNGTISFADISFEGGRFGNFEMMNHGQRGKSVQTDAEGRFVLDDIRPGQIWVVASGTHRDAHQGPLVMDAGKKLENVQITAERGAIVVVRLVDPDGRPVVSAKVTLRRPGKPGPTPPGQNQVFLSGLPMAINLGGRARSVGSGQTDKDGVCEIAGLEAGDYEITATHADWVSPEPTSVSVPAKDRIERELQMTRGGTVAMRVVDYRGKPAAEQRFRILAGDKTIRSGRTDATGRAVVGPLAAGGYEAVLQAASGQPRGMWGGFGGQTQAAEIGDRVPFTVKAGDEVAVSLIRPKLASLIGTVRDAAGPVENAIIHVIPKSKQQGSGHDFGAYQRLRRGRTDEHGIFRFDGLPPETYVVAIQRKQGGIAFSEEVLVQGTGEHQREFFVAIGSVELRVRTADGKPVAGVRVTLQRTSNSSVAWIGGSNIPPAVSDAEGIARFAEVSGGSYSISIQGKTHRMLARDPITIGPGESAAQDLLVSVAAVLHVAAIPAAGTEPLRSYRIMMTPVGSDKGTTHRIRVRGPEPGKVEGLQPGKYRVKAFRNAPNGKQVFSAEQEVELTAGRPTEIRIVLP